MSEFTISQINALGERLRKGKPDTADIERLDSYRRSFDEAFEGVIRTLRDLGLHASGRIKTTVSIVEKLKRQSFRLSKLEDIAGCRTIVDDIQEQNAVLESIAKAVPNTRLRDRRKNPSHGYRAVP